ncbi:GtrA family protein [Paraburkholderia sp. CNPSo 3281]|uniref:GtrA family protein n=1 Tax=Paraburkholderia sp. CNPSo 3281 TaxID=2940933 RepID=UPI0020B71EA6|nr:GtrA family protein [Paraburkholderia sp. CNPSo 3281]MCP3720359.1 GtrA family protein [Paraburkholderia sp. CNPSo 3281]
MNTRSWEVLRYVINGLFATAVHYSVLTFNLKVLHFPSAGAANLVAAIFGIAASFIGSRYFVFQNREGSIVSQAIKFSGLYLAIAALHGLVLTCWTDWLRLDYRIGFLVASFMQMSLSYFGNKRLVFADTLDQGRSSSLERSGK